MALNFEDLKNKYLAKLQPVKQTISKVVNSAKSQPLANTKWGNPQTYTKPFDTLADKIPSVKNENLKTLFPILRAPDAAKFITKAVPRFVVDESGTGFLSPKFLDTSKKLSTSQKITPEAYQELMNATGNLVMGATTAPNVKRMTPMKSGLYDAPRVQQSSSGNIYIKTGKNEVISGLPKTIQNDLYEIVQGRPVNPNRMYKTSEFLRKKGLELVRNEDTFKYELKKVAPNVAQQPPIKAGLYDVEHRTNQIFDQLNKIDEKLDKLGVDYTKITKARRIRIDIQRDILSKQKNKLLDELDKLEAISMPPAKSNQVSEDTNISIFQKPSAENITKQQIPKQHNQIITQSKNKLLDEIDSFGKKPVISNPNLYKGDNEGGIFSNQLNKPFKSTPSGAVGKVGGRLRAGETITGHITKNIIPQPNVAQQPVYDVPKTVKVWIKSKFSEGGGYADVPVIRKENNIKLYQGGYGEGRQFWTPDRKYAEQFGKVTEKTGDFYQVDNGNRMTKVYVEAKNVSQPLSVAETPMTPVKDIFSDSQAKILSKARPKTTEIPQKLLPKTEGQALAETIAQQAQKGTAKIRQFVTTVKESTKTAPEVKQMVEGYYIPKANDQLSRTARRQIAENIDLAREKALQGLDDESVAIANELIQHYSKMKDFDTAAEIANTAAENLTAHGRAVQAASLYDKLSPEGIQRYAASQLQKVKRVLKPEDSKRLFDMATEIQKMPAGTDKAMAQQKLMEEVQGLIPTPIYQKIITLWKAGLLTGLKTTGRNITSNTINAVSETVKDIPATTTDMIASLFTGKRSKTFNLKGSGSGFYEGLQKGVKTFLTGFDERKQMGKLDLNFVNWGNSRLGKIAKVYTNTIFRFLGAQDQPFYYSALKRSLYDQAKAEAINLGKRGDLKVIEDLVQNPTEQMIRNSVLDAETAVYQQKTSLGTAITKAKEALRGQSEFLKAGADYVAPFTGVPSGVLSQVVNYSPVGIAKTIISNIGKGKFDQRAFSQGMGRGITGIGILAIGYNLAKKGLMTLDMPTSERERQQWELEGKKPFSVLVNGKWRQIGSLGAQASALLSGGYLTKGITQYALGTLKQQKEQTFLQGVSTLTSAIDNPKGYAQGYLQGAAGSVIPTLIGDFAKGTDPLQREINSPMDAIKAKIPGLRTSLIAKRNAFGEQMPNEQGFIGTMIDIFNSSSAKDSTVIQELRRLMDAGFSVTPTKIDKTQTIGGQKVDFTPQLQDVFESTAGPAVKQIWQEMISSPEYSQLSDANKAKVLQNLIESIRKVEKLKVGAEVNPSAAATGITDLTKNERKYLATGQLPIKMPKEKEVKTLTDSQINLAKDILTGGGDVSGKLASFVIQTSKPKKLKKLSVPKIKIKKITFKTPKIKIRKPRRLKNYGKIRIKKIKI